MTCIHKSFQIIFYVHTTSIRCFFTKIFQIIPEQFGTHLVPKIQKFSEKMQILFIKNAIFFVFGFQTSLEASGPRTRTSSTFLFVGPSCIRMDPQTQLNPTFDKFLLRFRFRLRIQTIYKHSLKKKFEKILPFYIVSFFTRKKLISFIKFYRKM